MELAFEWDEVKARSNLRKHRVSFHEARTTFNDPYLLTFPDAEHSGTEDRFVSIGISGRSRVLVTNHTDRAGKVRIISSRRATARDRRFYEEGGF
jgi:uncharacterized DUF497 family protein